MVFLLFATAFNKKQCTVEYLVAVILLVLAFYVLSNKYKPSLRYLNFIVLILLRWTTDALSIFISIVTRDPINYAKYLDKIMFTSGSGF